MSARKRSERAIASLVILGVVFAACALTPASARAQERLIHIRTEVGTDFPLDLSARIAGELPGRLRLSTTLGYLPDAYVDAMNGLLVNWGAFDKNTGELIKSSLRQSLVMRVHTGWRPFPKEGFYIDAGYGVVALGGGTSAADILAKVVKKPLPIPTPDAKTFRIKSVVHMLDVEIGWETILGEHATLRLALGGAFTMGSTTQIRPTFDAGPFAQTVQAYSDDASGRLDHILRNYVFTPVLSMSAGYELF